MKTLIFFFFLLISAFALQAAEGINISPDYENTTKTKTFEITSEFVSTWIVKEVRDYAILEVIVTNDFKLAHAITEELRKFVVEPILVKHGFENNAITYTILIGRFDDTIEAEAYHNMLK
jgi:hypothetical protein